MANGPLSDLRTGYSHGEAVDVADLPKETRHVLVRTARGTTYEAALVNGVATFASLPVGTHALEARSGSRTLLAEEFFSVRYGPGDDPIMGFVTSFGESSRHSVLTWLRDLRCTVVQVYDWMESYSSPLSQSEAYEDPLGRPLHRSSLTKLIIGIKAMGSVAQAYAPICAADAELANAHPQWRLYRNDGVAQSLGDLLQVMNPASIDWQRHWIANYASAADALGFDGFHLDTYGYPRAGFSSQGALVAIDDGYAEFVDAVRRARPRDLLSFNQVNGVPRAFGPPAPPGFRYVEVWPPNDRWRHLEGLLQRSAGGGPRRGDTLALYPPVWDGDRGLALRTAVLSEAIATVLGASTLIWGDDHGVLCHPYYVNHERLSDEETVTVLEWRRFTLRCRDLFKEGTDTSWYELDDENASVTVSWDGPTHPEPIGGSLFARVVRIAGSVVVSLVDLSGSVDGAWSSGTGPGTCGHAEVSILVDASGPWRVEAAVLGRDGGRFQELPYSDCSMSEGRGLACVVPLVEGWSVLRVTLGAS